MIEIEHLNKTYPSPGGDIHALRDVNLRIEDGEIFGIIGLSGAGKSTLVRCINLLERPTSGTVRIDGRDMTQLSRRDLLKARQDIGMIFQSFNLLEQRTVLRNICFPLEIAGVKADGTDTEKAQAFIAEIYAMNERMGIPKGFDFIQEEDIPQIITWALAEANPNYPVPVVYNAARCRKVIDTIRAKAAENPPAEA